jgi:hypothetical protein
MFFYLPETGNKFTAQTPKYERKHKNFETLTPFTGNSISP